MNSEMGKSRELREISQEPSLPTYIRKLHGGLKISRRR